MNCDVLRRDDGSGLLVAPAGAPNDRLVLWEGLLPLPVGEHPSIAPVAFTAELDGRRVYAERVPRGVRLDEIELPSAVQTLVVVRLLEGVAHLHQHRLLHGDVQRNRVYLGVHGEVVLAGRARKGAIPALDLVAAVGLLSGSGDETLPGESAALAAAELARRVPAGAAAELVALVTARAYDPAPLARVALGSGTAEGTDEVVPDLGPDSGDHGILDRWGTTTATGNTGEVTPAARTDSGGAEVDRSEEFWQLVERIAATPFPPRGDVTAALRERVGKEPPAVLAAPAVVDEPPARPAPSEEFAEEPITAVRRSGSPAPVERTASAAPRAPGTTRRLVELAVALAFGFGVAALLAWLW